MFTQLNQYRVVLEVKPELAAAPAALDRASTSARRRTGRCRSPPFATFAPEPTSLSVNHQGQFPAITLSFNLAPDVSLGQAVDGRPPRRARDRDARERPRGVPGHGAGVRGRRSTSEPLLIVAALSPSTSCSACSTRATSTRSRSSRRCPRPASARCSRCCSFRTEFSIIALIGIILLIGIVKKNAIMMIDFAIEAERERGAHAGGGDPQGVPAALPAHHDDDAGGAPRRAAARARPRRGRRAAAGRSASPSSAACSSRSCSRSSRRRSIYLALDRFTRQRRWREADEAEPAHAGG